MSKGLGPIQTATLEYLIGLEGWAADASEVARFIYSDDWSPPFTSARYQTVARALRTLASRGLIAKCVTGRYHIPELQQ